MSQSEPSERHLGQYCPMSGGQFLISEKNSKVSQKFLKIKALINKGVEIDFTVLSTGENSDQMTKLTENLV